MPLTNEQLVQLKEKLLTEKVNLENQLSQIGTPVDKAGDYRTNFDELGSDQDASATEVEEYTDNLAVENNLEKQLHEVLSALASFDTGSYGKCADCGEEISFERLLAYPAAKTCVKCNK